MHLRYGYIYVSNPSILFIRLFSFFKSIINNKKCNFRFLIYIYLKSENYIYPILFIIDLKKKKKKKITK